FVNRPIQPPRVFTAGVTSEASQQNDMPDASLSSLQAEAVADALSPRSVSAETATETIDPAPTSAMMALDILGIRLGMPMDEADKIARGHLTPDAVYRLETQNPARGYRNGTLYVSYTQAESITLLTDAEGRVAGIDRRLVLPAEAPLESIRQ